MTFGTDVIKDLEKYGIHKKSIQILPESVTADSLEYSDIINDAELSRQVIAVIEDDDRPLLYVVPLMSLSKDDATRTREIRSLASRLACRGAVSYICLVEFGQLTIFPCGLIEEGGISSDRDGKRLTVRASDDNAIYTFQNLLQGHEYSILSQEKSRYFTPIQIRDILRDILLKVCEKLLKSNIFGDSNVELKNSRALALVGRAVFARFLSDRKIINECTCPKLYEDFGGPEQAFDTLESSIYICAWLDETFNGEFLPLSNDSKSYDQLFADMFSRNKHALRPLGQIMRKQITEGMTPLWELVDFSHVPAGVLSEVYEQFVFAYDKDRAKAESVYYTPQHIADMVVTQAFNGIPESARSRVRAIDPAAGAGVFLVTVLKKLIEYKWAETDKPLTSADIRDVLYNQVRGLDINKSALLLAALSLYLTVIELGPKDDVKNLKFDKNLIGNVLIDVSSSEDSEQLGTLRHDLPDGLFGTFDIVVGNPPWTSKSDAVVFQEQSNAIAKAIIAERTNEAASKVKYINPDKSADIPFVWRAMEFAKPDGIIAMLLHARLLFGQHTRDARRRLSQTLRIHGIINASSFSDEKDLWAVKMPFLMLLARNRVPSQDDRFWYISPYLDKPLAQRGKMRIDARQAHVIRHGDLQKNSGLLRVLYRGTTFDQKIIQHIENLLGSQEKIVGSKFVRISDLLKKDGGIDGIRHSVGYKKGKKTREKSTLALKKAHGLGLTTEYSDTFPNRYFVAEENLESFGLDMVYRIREVEYFTPPLVLIFERQKEDLNVPQALLALGKRPIIFNGSFIGISTAGAAEGEMLARYLAVILNSDLATYYHLMTSAHFGVSFRRVNANEIYDLPIHDYYQLDDRFKSEIKEISDMMLTEGDKQEIRRRINNFISEMYGLQEWDSQVIEDTLATQLPFSNAIKQAQRPIGTREFSAYISEVSRIVENAMEKIGRPAEVKVPGDARSPWLYFSVQAGTSLQSNEIDYKREYVMRLSEEIADNSGATSIRFVVKPKEHVVIGVLNQYRHWTITRARLMAGEIIHILS